MYLRLFNLASFRSQPNQVIEVSNRYYFTVYPWFLCMLVLMCTIQPREECSLSPSSELHILHTGAEMAQLTQALGQWVKGRGFDSRALPTDCWRCIFWTRCLTCRSHWKLMVAHEQQGFPCIYAKQTVSHKSQTAGLAAESCGTRLALYRRACLIFLSTNKVEIFYANGLPKRNCLYPTYM